MSARDTSEPASPTPSYDPMYNGMTLRDWLAGQALASGHVWGIPPSKVGPITPEQCATAHYSMADAMLAERSKP